MVKSRFFGGGMAVEKKGCYRDQEHWQMDRNLIRGMSIWERAIMRRAGVEVIGS